MSDKQTLTPMMVQYFAIKEKYPDALLFYRLGDFYELFYEDAIIASEILEITLTSRNKNAENPVAMCGVPHHAAAEYIKTLVDKGYKVALCEQLEDAKQTKGMVKRDVVQVITPGTVLDPKNKDDKTNHYLLALDITEDRYHLAYCDVALGDMKVTSVESLDALLTQLSGINAVELVTKDTLTADVEKVLQHHVQTFSTQMVLDTIVPFEHLLKAVKPEQERVLRLLLSYIITTQKRDLSHLQEVAVYDAEQFLKLDHTVKYNLELLQSIRTKQKKGSLLWVLDDTKTAMGGRLLKQWLDKPLIDLEAIIKRQDQVTCLMNHYFERLDIVESLKSIYDLERLVGRIAFGSVNAKELVQLKVSLQQIPHLKQMLIQMNGNQEWLSVLNDLDTFDEIVALINHAIDDEPPTVLSEGNIIKSGYNAQLDVYRDAMKNGKLWIAQLQQQERDRTGIKTLKIGYNKVFGYYIEITKSNLSNLPEGLYERKQTLANAERFVTQELKEKERLILDAQEKSTLLEYELFIAVRDEVKRHTKGLQRLAKAVSSIDVLQSFASISEQYHYVRPQLSLHNRDIHIVQGRHPVVEKVIGKKAYVPNDLNMIDSNDLLLITGPNMSGKSTFMRQLALMSIMAQMGCFVPANSAQLPIFDRMFTRIGAADDLISGQSTFMVEMMETNQALRYATDYSLILFDEIGRGTATYDGMALAEAILRYVHKHIKAKALFSTHYHELTALDTELNRLKNVHVGAIEQQGQLIFLHQLMDGPADKSYGLHVAQLADLPNELIAQARVILTTLEKQNHVLQQADVVETSPVDAQELFVTEQLKAIDLDDLTPRQVVAIIAQLQEKLK